MEFIHRHQQLHHRRLKSTRANHSIDDRLVVRREFTPRVNVRVLFQSQHQAGSSFGSVYFQVEPGLAVRSCEARKRATVSLRKKNDAGDCRHRL